jgi:hypothetical protein
LAGSVTDELVNRLSFVRFATRLVAVRIRVWISILKADEQARTESVHGRFMWFCGNGMFGDDAIRCHSLRGRVKCMIVNL